MKEKDLKLIAAFSAYLNEMLVYPEEWVKRAIAKFARGRKEHADQNPLELNFDEEIEQEQMDIVAYSFLKDNKETLMSIYSDSAEGKD